MDTALNLLEKSSDKSWRNLKMAPLSQPLLKLCICAPKSILDAVEPNRQFVQAIRRAFAGGPDDGSYLASGPDLAVELRMYPVKCAIQFCGRRILRRGEPSARTQSLDSLSIEVHVNVGGTRVNVRESLLRRYLSEFRLLQQFIDAPNTPCTA